VRLIHGVARGKKNHADDEARLLMFANFSRFCDDVVDVPDGFADADKGGLYLIQAQSAGCRVLQRDAAARSSIVGVESQLAVGNEREMP
jgi:hypothetical protein